MNMVRSFIQNLALIVLLVSLILGILAIAYVIVWTIITATEHYGLIAGGCVVMIVAAVVVTILEHL